MSKYGHVNHITKGQNVMRSIESLMIAGIIAYAIYGATVLLALHFHLT